MSDQQLLSFVTALLPFWRKSQRTVLALCGRGVGLESVRHALGISPLLPAST